MALGAERAVTSHADALEADGALFLRLWPSVARDGRGGHLCADRTAEAARTSKIDSFVEPAPGLPACSGALFFFGCCVVGPFVLSFKANRHFIH